MTVGLLRSEEHCPSPRVRRWGGGSSNVTRRRYNPSAVETRNDPVAPNATVSIIAGECCSSWAIELSEWFTPQVRAEAHEHVAGITGTIDRRGVVIARVRNARSSHEVRIAA